MNYASIRLTHESCDLRVALNGVPIYRQRKEGTAEAFVNEWLSPTGNRLSLRVDWPHERPFVANTAAVRVNVLEVEPGESVREAVPTATFTWPGAVKEGYPYLQTLPLTLTGREMLLWKRTTVVQQVTVADRTELLQQLQQLRGLLQNQDWDAAATVFGRKFRDLDIAYGKDEGATQGSFTRALSAAAARAEWKLDSFGPEEVAIAIVGGGHLVAATRPNGDALIRLSPDSPGRWSLPVYFGKIADAWTIVR